MSKLELLIPIYESYDKVNGFITQLADNVLSDNIRLLLSFDKDDPKLEDFVRKIDSPYIRIVKNEELKGLDGNIKNLIQKSFSDYFWIISHDDVVEDSTIFAVYNLLSSVELDLLFLDYSTRKISNISERPFEKIDSWFNSIGFRSSYLPSVIYRRGSLAENIPNLDYKNWYDFIHQLYIDGKTFYRSRQPLLQLTGLSHDSPWNVQPVQAIWDLYILVFNTGKVPNNLILKKIRPYVLKKILYAKAKGKGTIGARKFSAEYLKEKSMFTSVLIRFAILIPDKISKYSYEFYQKQKRRVN